MDLSSCTSQYEGKGEGKKQKPKRRVHPYPFFPTNCHLIDLGTWDVFLLSQLKRRWPKYGPLLTGCQSYVVCSTFSVSEEEEEL